MILKSTVFIIVLILVNVFNTDSQTICGIDVSNPDSTIGYMYNNSLDAAGTDMYVKNDPGMFDRVLLNKGLGYICTINYPNTNRFLEVYNDLVNKVGYENYNLDEIPKNVDEDDITSICLLISDGKAQIIRYWYEQKFNIKLEFTQKNLELYISYF